MFSLDIERIFDNTGKLDGIEAGFQGSCRHYYKMGQILANQQKSSMCGSVREVKTQEGVLFQGCESKPVFD